MSRQIAPLKLLFKTLFALSLERSFKINKCVKVSGVVEDVRARGRKKQNIENSKFMG